MSVSSAPGSPRPLPGRPTRGCAGPADGSGSVRTHPRRRPRRRPDRGPDVRATETRRPAATVLATDATVVLVSPESSGAGRRDRVVMLALPAPAAGAVATASLTDALTVTLR